MGKEKIEINALKYNLDLLQTDHLEKSKRYQNKNLLSDDNIENLWDVVDEIVGKLELEIIDQMDNDEFNQLPTETKEKAMQMIMSEVDEFSKDLEKYTMIREFAPVLMAELMGRKLGEDKLISSKTTQRHILLAKETMKYAEALADEVMDRTPDKRYNLPNENVQRPENESIKHH